MKINGTETFSKDYLHKVFVISEKEKKTFLLTRSCMSLSSHNHNSISFLKPFPMAQMPQKTFEKTLRTGSSPKKLAEAFTIETSKWPQNLESNR